MSVKYQQNEKHFNYTTPKSFLEFMKLYDNLLRKKRTELTQKMDRIENGLQKLKNTASQVGSFTPQGKNTCKYLLPVHRLFDLLLLNRCVTFCQVEDLKAKLAVQEVELWQRNEEIEALLAKIGQQTDKVNQERSVADEEEQKVRVLYFKVFKAGTKWVWEENKSHMFSCYLNYCTVNLLQTFAF